MAIEQEPVTAEPQTESRADTDAAQQFRDESVRRAFALVEYIERLPQREYLARYGDQLAAEANWARETMSPLQEWPGAPGYYFKIMTRDGSFIRVRRIVDFVLPGDRVLDIGCGRGYLTGVLLRDSPLKSYTGIDILEENFGSARSMIETNGLGERLAQFERKDVYDLTPDWVAEHDPSLVIMLEMLEHVPDAERALATVARSLPAGASMVFSVPVYGRLEGVWGHLSVFDVPRIRRMCRAAGLHIQHLETIYGTWALVLATTSDEVDPRSLHVIRQDPPTPQPPGRIQEFVNAVIRRARVLRAGSGAKLVALHAGERATKVKVVGSASPFRSQYGGLSLDLDGDLAVRLELAFEGGRGIRKVFVDLVDEDGNPTARWVRRCGLLRQPPSRTKRTFVFAPGRPPSRFRQVGPVRMGVATTANVGIEVLPTRTGGFSLTRAASLRERPA
ncbi:MAG TPA: class I SAM-dependent methyltransferase [Actinomycetes bacterium]|nr:class I SAM-dependent methyltransferase [Actinomycetes bacterium]